MSDTSLDYVNATDEKLVEIYCSGLNQKQFAFSELVKRYQSLLFARSFRYLQSVEEAEEVVQNTWLGVIKTLQSHFSPENSSFRRWLYGVLKNKLIDYMRRRKNIVAFNNLQIPTTQNFVCESDVKKVIELCIDKFPEKYRTLLTVLVAHRRESLQAVAKILEETTLLELAERIRKPLLELQQDILAMTGENIVNNTLKTRRYRAMEFLQHCLEKNGVTIE
ncbi:RNA polymerase sigma factor [Candidatus Uabimicrobium sp. HlEnr_7]|uniref:RNA polymerase sigma factor n=1 Tax=Candidatus Uabimicrobium helgolandensis TaxID=3095367 RepID=UPI003557871F